MNDVYIRLNANPLKIDGWRNHLGLSTSTTHSHRRNYSTVPTPDVLFARAVPFFLEQKDTLLRRGWRHAQQLPPGMLFILESPKLNSKLHRSSSPKYPRSAASYLDAGGMNNHPATLALPAELSAFIEYREEIQQILHDPTLFRGQVDHEGTPFLSSCDTNDATVDKALRNIFYMLQLLVPGMFLIVHDSLSFLGGSLPSLTLPDMGESRIDKSESISQSPASSSESLDQPVLKRTRRALPPAKWIERNMIPLVKVFGKEMLSELLDRSQDLNLTIWRTLYGPYGDRIDVEFDGGLPLNEDSVNSRKESRKDDESNDMPSVTPGLHAHEFYVGFARRGNSL